ncbi:MAG: hypothetical protein FWF41_02210 [Betaproteobacteria bacterium]|nr:hypothetical protein [Betaproteobacteria bacterium]
MPGLCYASSQPTVLEIMPYKAIIFRYMILMGKLQEFFIDVIMEKLQLPSIYSPFPSNVRADPVRGAFFEEILSDGGSKYVIVRAKKYNTDERHRRWLQDGTFTIDKLYPEIYDLGRMPREDCLWFYKLESFTVARIYHEDQEMFVEHAENYSQQVFDDYCELMDFCLKVHQIRPEDFKKDWETNYPQR